MKKIFWTLIVLMGLVSRSISADNGSYAAKSVFNSGKWVKIQVEETGVYKLSATDLKKMGFGDVSHVAVYGYGGQPIDEDFSSASFDDLPEVATYRDGDNVLFYASGPRKWSYSDTDGFRHTNNPYSNYGYYFVTEKTEAPRSIPRIASATGASIEINTFDDYFLWEKEQVSVNNSGRELYGESFENTTSRDFSVSIPGITNEPGRAYLSFIAKSPNAQTAVTLNIDNKQILGLWVPRSSSSNSYTVAAEARGGAIWTGDKSETFKVNIQYGASSHKNARLNYFILQTRRSLKNYDAYTLFRSLDARGKAARFVVGASSEASLVFDVTDGANPQQIETTIDGTNMSFSIDADSRLREFAAVQPSQLKSPVIIGQIANQNLHGIEQQDMIIIAAPAFTAQAERLAEVHRVKDKLKVKVVAPGDIYNEFSSGTPDASAYRRFMKMLYDRRTSEADAPKYLLLFGDGSYDNRQLTSGWKQVDMSNMLLTYQTVNSLTEFSYVVDDYFGMLDDADNKKSLERRKVNIGIGRFPVRTVAEATKAVNKVIKYINNDEIGQWKNNIGFMADDGSSYDGFSQEHTQQADTLGAYVSKYHPEFIVNKLYYDAYKKTLTGGENGYPDVKKKLEKLLKDGLLLFNYTGHGSVTALSDEKIVTQADINQYSYTKLPAWVTATCDFTRFDDISTSSGEDVFLHPTSGGIALFSTTRVAYSPYNAYINSSLIRNLFEKKDGKRRTLGDVMKEMKCQLIDGISDIYKLGFCLIGDPALKLSYPEYGMKVTAVNGQEAYGEAIPFRALDKITVEGIVTDLNGNVASDYNGVLYPTVKDSKVEITCLNNNKISKPPFKFVDYPNNIYMGNDSVRGGKFKFTFTVPKDISYSNLFGKMNLYAHDAASGIEAQGNYENFIVGGTGDEISKDTVGPEIKRLYLNDTTFVDGGKVNTTPYFVAELWDESGVNIAGSSVGHDMMLVIDDNLSLSYNLNSYYKMASGEEGSGRVGFSIPKLEPGLHKAEFWAWDIQNNSTMREFSFVVEKGLQPFLFDLNATPVPARDNITFHLSHDRPESKMLVGIMVYDLAGRQIWKHEEEGSSEIFKSYNVSWDLTSSGGMAMRPGVYLYRAAIKTDNSKEASKTKKLIILGR